MIWSWKDRHCVARENTVSGLASPIAKTCCVFDTVSECYKSRITLLTMWLFFFTLSRVTSDEKIITNKLHLCSQTCPLRRRLHMKPTGAWTLPANLWQRRIEWHHQCSSPQHRNRNPLLWAYFYPSLWVLISKTCRQPWKRVAKVTSLRHGGGLYDFSYFFPSSAMATRSELE